MADIDAPDLSRSCLVVAHPDDEILWFSSIVERVGKVLLCFEDCDDYPELGPGRRALLASYPLPQLTSLRLPEPCSFHLVDWSRPEPDELGLALNAPQASAERRERYRRTFHVLRAAFARELQGFPNVFTHNPWGEYGHPDHVQVARVVDSLRGELGFRTFHSGYIAHRTMPLAAAVLPRVGRWFELSTQPSPADAIEALYRRHGCWTWPAGHPQFASETFLEASGEPPAPGSGFRLNYVSAWPDLGVR